MNPGTYLLELSLNYIVYATTINATTGPTYGQGMDGGRGVKLHGL